MGQEKITFHGSDPPTWKGTSRYEILSAIGRGGMGAVYEALDRERQQIVALKTLLHFGPAALYRFKQEFRTLADVNHKNLVHLYELVVGETDEVFFTMELVRGVHFLEYVQRPTIRSGPTPPTTVVTRRPERNESVVMVSGTIATDGASRPTHSPADLTRLRRALRQLIEGIGALHAAGKLHRDVKPSNVLVTHEGRVVLLDFGVATELRIEADPPVPSDEMVGTARYMAPEQSTGEPPTPASDFYSAGVMLYEALVGRPPFVGSAVDVITMKCGMTPPPPSACVLGVPDDLDALCMALLHREPAMRPTGEEILRRLGARTSTTAPPAAADSVSTFVGRRNELQALREAFEISRSGKQITVRVAGASGIGKSTVVHHFLDELVRDGEAVVLRGRVYERESIPYKAVDSAIDALSRHLIRLDEGGDPLPLPDDVWALARLFPVLQRVPCVASPAHASAELLEDSRGVLRRAFVALRDLFSSLAERQPLVIFIDDTQWGDVDSVALLVELMRPPHAPPLLLVMTYRAEEAAKSPFLVEMEAAWPAAAEVRDIQVGPLPEDEVYQMALSLLGSSDEGATRTARTAVRESSGSPLLVEELVRINDGSAGRGGVTLASTLEQMVSERLGALPDAARRLAELVAVAGCPLPISTFAAASDLVNDADEWVTLLRAQRFVRARFRDGREVIEPIHDRIRETIVTLLSADVLQQRHARLATVLEATPGADAEAIAVHMLGAGDKQRGARFAEAAAEQADEKLAFDQAARLFQLSLTITADESGALAQRLRVRLAQVLERGGRPCEAADAYRKAAERATAIDRIELETSAGEQLVFGGRVDEGAVVLRQVLGVMGIRAPRTAVGAVFLLLFYRVCLRVVGLRFRERESEEVSRENRVRVAALRAVSQGLGSSNVILGACMQARHMLLAMRVGDRFQVLLAVLGQVAQFAIAGKPEGKREREMIEIARGLAQRCGGEDSAYFEGALGIVLYMRGRYREACNMFDGIEALARGSHRLGTAFARQYAIYACFYLGRLREEARRAARLLKDAEDRGDVYTIVSLRTAVLVDIGLAADDPDGARRQLREAMAHWPQNGFYVQHWFAMISEAGIDLYVGDGARAYERMERDARALKRSFLLHARNVRGFTSYTRACCAIASIDGRIAPAARRARIREARRLGRALERARDAWSPPLASLVAAMAANASGDRNEAIKALRAATKRAETADMALHGWAASYQLGSLLGGDEGKALAAQAEQSMTAEGIRDPFRMARLLVPGRWQ
jgi:serine/threonine protein kinase/tetratricopeptide (TPR) repeat protein